MSTAASEKAEGGSRRLCHSRKQIFVSEASSSRGECNGEEGYNHIFMALFNVFTLLKLTKYMIIEN